MGLDVQSRMACVGDTICYLSSPKVALSTARVPECRGGRLEGVESRAANKGVQAPQWAEVRRTRSAQVSRAAPKQPGCPGA